MIVVVDYGMGNLRSVAKALEMAGAEVLISAAEEDLSRAERIVLPGVGTFGEGMINLKKLNLIEPLSREVLEKRKPFLGICLGMHLLADQGYEKGINSGLGWVSGQVKEFDLKAKEFKIPHMGWDDVRIKSKSPLFLGINSPTDFYFVHCCHFNPDDDRLIIADCDYGGIFTAALQEKNIFATQFHPEKSQESGLRILENFIEWEPNA